MAIPVHKQAQYWAAAGAVLLVALWLLGDVILPFVLGGALAYMLDPLADRLEEAGASRGVAVGVISVIVILLFVLLILLVIPTMVQQTVQLVQSAPTLVSNLQAWLTVRFPDLMAENGPVQTQLAAIARWLQENGTGLVSGLLSSAMSVLNIVVLLVVVPVVAVYMLLDWDRMIGRIDHLLPRDHAPEIRQIAAEIDRTLASFIRGQGLVCLIQGTFYAVTLAMAGLNFGLVVGAFAGLISFIPYVGSLVGGCLAIGLALFQFWGDWVMIGVVAAIFGIGQFAEGNILTPRLVGNSVGLHPVWLIFALSVFGTLFGFVGMLVAVPLAAMLGVIVRFALGKYMEGRLYRGSSGPDA